MIDGIEFTSLHDIQAHVGLLVSNGFARPLGEAAPVFSAGRLCLRRGVLLICLFVGGNLDLAAETSAKNPRAFSAPLHPWDRATGMWLPSFTLNHVGYGRPRS